MNSSPKALWDQTLSLISENVSEKAYITWFKPIVFESFNPSTLTLLVQVPSSFVYEYLEEHYVELLSKCLHRTFGSKVKLAYRVVVVKNPSVGVDIEAGTEDADIESRKERTRMNEGPTP